MHAILSTGPLSEALIAKAANAGITITVQSFITTVPIDTIDTTEEIGRAAELETTVVFTSPNAVDAVINQLGDQVPDWQIYCLRGASSKKASAYFGAGSLVGVADNASALANNIIESGEVAEAFFFCGNLRRDTLPHQLREAGILVHEIPVYNTVIHPHKINGPFAGVLFFSPSAVDGFFKHNRLSEQTLVFAIGTTTAEALQKYSPSKIVLPESPGKDQLVEKLITILGKDAPTNKNR